MQHIYYIEVNSICLILLFIVYARLRQNKTIVSASQRALRRTVEATALLCASDIVAGVVRGQMFAGARTLIHISNLVYLWSMVLLAMQWSRYVCKRTHTYLTMRGKIIFILPFVAFSIVVLTNPITSFFFSINDANLYVRGPGVFLHWLVSWGYFIFSGILSLKAVRNAPNALYKSELMPLIYFLVLPTIGCVLQMVFYGVTSVQAGTVLSIVLVSMKMQDNQIFTDELTTLNNRRSLNYYIESLTTRDLDAPSMLMMIDVDRFKSINDTYGHSVGDIVLKDSAAIFKKIGRKVSENLFISRYGGDEFVIIAPEAGEDFPEQLKAMIEEEVAAYELKNKHSYHLSLSVGYVYKTCKTRNDFEIGIEAADVAMYTEKRKKHSVR